MAVKPEERVQIKVEKYLNELIEQGEHIIYERREAIGLGYKKGRADLWACIDGIHIEIELKKPDGQQSVMQEKFQNKCKKFNTLYLLIDNVEDFKREINNLLTNLKNNP